jgi:hypothetical protein
MRIIGQHLTDVSGGQESHIAADYWKWRRPYTLIPNTQEGGSARAQTIPLNPTLILEPRRKEYLYPDDGFAILAPDTPNRQELASLRRHRVRVFINGSQRGSHCREFLEWMFRRPYPVLELG